MAVTLLCSLAGTAAAAGGGGSGGQPAAATSASLSKAEKLIKQEKWDDAVAVLTKAAASDPSSADVQNWLGYAERHRGNMDAAFGHYEAALKLDPKHRGAHEYVGEAYLMVGDVGHAREHLAALQRLCGPKCEEYRDLQKEIETYEARHASAAP
jgi:tetratricopeptide (TPR) repeat protein